MQTKPKEMTTVDTSTRIYEWVSQGKTRLWIMDKLQEEGMTYSAANQLYYHSLKELQPEPNLLDDYKKVLIKQNLDRLEKIVNDCIGGNTGDKKVALQAIDTLNKMCGVYSDKNITIAQQNKDGDQQIIQIRFGE